MHLKNLKLFKIFDFFLRNNKLARLYYTILMYNFIIELHVKRPSDKLISEPKIYWSVRKCRMFR